MMRSDTVHLAHPFLGRRMEARDELITQLRGYNFVIKESKSSDPSKPSKVFLSGKGAGKQARKSSLWPRSHLSRLLNLFASQDDLAIVVQMCSLWPLTYIGSGNKCLLHIS
jgi:hypothetical protein